MFHHEFDIELMKGVFTYLFYLNITVNGQNEKKKGKSKMEDEKDSRWDMSHNGWTIEMTHINHAETINQSRCTDLPTPPSHTQSNRRFGSKVKMKTKQYDTSFVHAITPVNIMAFVWISSTITIP